MFNKDVFAKGCFENEIHVFLRDAVVVDILREGVQRFFGVLDVFSEW